MTVIAINLLDEYDLWRTAENVRRFFSKQRGSDGKIHDSMFNRFKMLAVTDNLLSSIDYDGMPKSKNDKNNQEEMLTKHIEAQLVVETVEGIIKNLPSSFEHGFSQEIMKRYYLENEKDHVIYSSLGLQSTRYYELKQLAAVRFAEIMDEKLIIGHKFVVNI
ncbi:ArpU family phage packaging/lysis transcriptional regulator [Weissella sp. MSCH1]|uniref:ArpU family phage packaging/lysis transcriptional regulator n=1 Tax=Weissella sp. MSCH1 TaxID=3383343 RepID=UPI003896D360